MNLEKLKAILRPWALIVVFGSIFALAVVRACQRSPESPTVNTAHAMEAYVLDGKAHQVEWQDTTPAGLKMVLKATTVSSLPNGDFWLQDGWAYYAADGTVITGREAKVNTRTMRFYDAKPSVKIWTK